MRLHHILCMVIAVTLAIFSTSIVYSGGPGNFPSTSISKTKGAPPLDLVLMKFKEQGVWYFPCVAPVTPYRIPPSPLVVAPPPPPCGPAPMAPCPPALRIHK